MNARVVLLVGTAIAFSPAIWYPLVWPPQTYMLGAMAWIVLGAFSILPFLVIALLRRWARMSRATTVIAVIACGTFVVLGQEAGLNPNDPSSTASIALVLVPIEACFLAVGLRVAEHVFCEGRQLYRRCSRQMRTPT